MSEHIDHAAKAHVLLNNIRPDEMGDSDSTNWLLSAQVHATLALVEQQRIANLITVSGWVMDSTKEDVGYDLDKLRTGVAGEVWEGLGL